MNFHRKHTVDELFFDAINTEEKAYWLGFLTADGYIYKDQRNRPCGVGIRLGEKDIGHLRKWRTVLRGTHSIDRVTSRVRGRATVQVRMHAGSIRLADALVNLGVTPAKSLTVKPAKIPQDLERHYWRGVFDGDGCIHRRSDRRRWTLDISGTQAITEGFQKFLLARGIDTKTKPRRAGKHLWRIQFCGVALPRQIAKLLYDGASVYLDRKYKQYLKLAAAKDSHRRLGKAGWIAARQAYQRLGTWKAAAKEVGISVMTIRRMREKWNAA